MLNNKLVKYVFILILITSLIVNYYLYKENASFMNRIGSENLATVRLTLHELDDGSTDFFIETLKEEDGDVLLERHIGELNQFSQKFHRMSGQMSVIGIVLDHLINLYYQLQVSVQSGKNIEDNRNEINMRLKFIETVLNQINSDLGDNQKLWYKELSGYDTETQKYVWAKFKQFENQNK
jgi:hypothetical protein